MVKWTTVVSPLCEGTHLPGIGNVPEFAGLVASIVPILLGLLGLYKGSSTSPQELMPHALMVFGGFGSALFHWTLQWGWRSVDIIFTALVVAFAGINMASELIDTLRHRAPKSKRLSAFTVLYTVIVGIYIVAFVPLASSVDSVFATRVLSAAPFLMVIFTAIWAAWVSKKVSALTPDSMKMIWAAIISSIVSLVLWGLDTWACGAGLGIEYARAHAAGKASGAYATFCVASLSMFMRADNVGRKAQVRMWPHRRFPLIPIVWWTTSILGGRGRIEVSPVNKT